MECNQQALGTVPSGYHGYRGYRGKGSLAELLGFGRGSHFQKNRPESKEVLAGTMDAMGFSGWARYLSTSAIYQRAKRGESEAILGLAQRVLERTRMVGSAIPQGMQSFAQAGTPGAGGYLGNLSNIATVGGMAIGGPWGGTIAAIGSLGKVTADVANAFQNLSSGLAKSNLEFSTFSPAMTGVQARQYMRDLKYEQERGEARAESTERLLVAQDLSRQGLAKTGDTFNDLWSRTASWFEMSKDVMGNFLTGGNPDEVDARWNTPEGKFALGKMSVEEFEKQKGSKIGANDMFPVQSDLQVGDRENLQWYHTHGRPQRWMGGIQE